MGLNYAYNVVTSQASVDALVDALAACVASDDAARLRAARPWRPRVERSLVWGGGRPERERVGFGGLAPRPHERGNTACLGLLCPLDPEVAAYEGAQRAVGREGDRVVVGCVDTTLRVGEEFALLTATACTSAMSRLFARSAAVRGVFAAMAEAAHADAAFLDTEEEYAWERVWPAPARVGRVSIDSFCSGDFESVRVDAYVCEMLRVARMP